ncbi:hypothetical protein B1218_34215, partial [Pseudomonas ogarae]
LWPETVNQLGTQITARERDVLRLLLSPFSNKEIAGKLSLSAETTNAHYRNIYAQLNTKLQSELFAPYFMPNQNVSSTHLTQRTLLLFCHRLAQPLPPRHGDTDRFAAFFECIAPAKFCRSRVHVAALRGNFTSKQGD